MEKKVITTEQISVLRQFTTPIQVSIHMICMLNPSLTSFINRMELPYPLTLAYPRSTVKQSKAQVRTVR